MEFGGDGTFDKQLLSFPPAAPWTLGPDGSSPGLSCGSSSAAASCLRITAVCADRSMQCTELNATWPSFPRQKEEVALSLRVKPGREGSALRLSQEVSTGCQSCVQGEDILAPPYTIHHRTECHVPTASHALRCGARHVCVERDPRESRQHCSLFVICQVKLGIHSGELQGAISWKLSRPCSLQAHPLRH